MSTLFGDAAFTLRPGELSCRLKNDLFQEILLFNFAVHVLEKVLL